MRLGKALGPATLILIVATALATGAFTQTKDPQPSAQTPPRVTAALPANPLNDIAWMKGGVWVAEVKDAAGIVATRIETRIGGSENGRLMKFTTTFVEHNQPHLQYEGIYLYDPQGRHIAFYYTDSDGNFTRGHAVFAAGTLTQDFEIIHMNGQADTLRSLVVRDGDDAYNWNVMSQKSGEWKEIFHLRYVRQKTES